MPRLMRAVAMLTVALVLLSSGASVEAKKKKKKAAQEQAGDPYAEFVWPPPPDEPRIKLHQMFDGRASVEGRSRWREALVGKGPQSPYEFLRKPFAVAFDSKGRILVTDSRLAAIFRFDREGEKLDILGTAGHVRLKQPLGLYIGDDDTAFVADAQLQQVVAYAPDGRVKAVYGEYGELENPTDATLTPGRERLYVTDSKAHQIVVYDAESAAKLFSFGELGIDEGRFHYPTSLAFDSEGNLLVVDQLNARVQVLTPEGEYLDEFGAMGIGYGDFTRPKDIVVDEWGLIYVTDTAFNNFQLFDVDLTLLTFVGQGGWGPGQFMGASGIAVRGDEIAVVDQMGRRVQVFRYVFDRSGG